MSDDGSYVFFDTADPLVARDGNRTLDVYEWTPMAISLISSGSDPAPSFFIGASSDGANVFFGTHARLVSQDTDTNGDLYDARICTEASPCISPPPGETAQCQGDACQPPSTVPIDATPSSITFTGPGNFLVSKGRGSKPQTRTQLLKKALRKCRKKRGRSRASCIRGAEKRYGVKLKAKHSKHLKTRGRNGK
jgi:hypothetical protein